MSTRSKRASSGRSVREHTETYTFDESTENGRSTSPNPQRWSRLQEKEQLSNLNDRLATYIDKVRSLEAENARLHVQIRDVEVIERKEKENLHERYESKIADLRRAMEGLARDKAKIELESSGAIAKYNDLKQKHDKIEKDFKRIEKERNSFSSMVSDLQHRADDNDARRRHAEARLAELEKELDGLQRKVDSLTTQLEDEVLLRGELQNQLASAKEDLEFARLNHSNQMEEFRRKRQVEMTTVSNEIENRYQAKLHEQLQAMRADFDARMASSRKETSEMYRIRDERIADLERQLNDLLLQYQDLLDLKVQLDTELQAYHKLLEGEETRLHITPTPTPNTSTNMSSSNINTSSNQHVSFNDVINASGIRRGIKRRRLEQDDLVRYDRTSRTFNTRSDSDTDVEIDDVDTEGRYIRLINKGTEDFSIGTWSVKSIAGDREVTFKFHSKQVIKPDQTITIWSCDSGETHKTPNVLVMKNQSWPTGNTIRAEMLNEDGTVVAHREMFLESGFRDHLDSSDPADRCCIM